MRDRGNLPLQPLRGPRRYFPHGRARWGLLAGTALQLFIGCKPSGDGSPDADTLDLDADTRDLGAPADLRDGPAFRLSIALASFGGGTVTSKPAKISCGGGGLSCMASFPAGSTVQLTATAASGSVFSRWTGACAGQGAVCMLDASADLITTARFGLTGLPGGLCWEAPLPFGYNLTSVAAVSPTDVWAVGEAGAIVHYDGVEWSLAPSGTSQDLGDVWARATNDVWATAGAGLMLHWDGTNWNKVATGFPDVTNLVWGTADQLFVPTVYEFVLKFDGTSWTKVDTGTRLDTALSAITGTSNRDVWVLGADRYLCHFSGKGWTCKRPDPAADPAYNAFANTTGAWAASDNDVWDVTANGVVLHSNPVDFASGTMGFTVLPTHVVAAGNTRGLWGTSSTSLFSNGPAATLYRFDGTKWNPNPTGVKDVSVLTKVHGTSNSDVWSVGQRGVIAHYDGTGSTVKRDNVFSGSNLLGVWASGPRDAWFVTSAGTVVHYDGAAFSESAPLVLGGGAALRTIWGTSATDVWVGGTDGINPVLNHWDGTAWTLFPGAAGFSAFAIDTLYAGSATLAFASGQPALAVEKWNGTSWQVDLTLDKLTNPVTALWGSSATNVLAAEQGSSKLWVYDGATWTVDPRIKVPLYSLGGSGASDIWAGAIKAVYHFDGTAWTMIPIPQAQGYIASVSAVSATDAWAIDQAGGAYHFDGATWQTINTGLSPRSPNQFHVFSVDPTLTWVAGRGILSSRK